MIKIWKYKNSGKSFNGFHMYANEKFMRELTSNKTINIESITDDELSVPNNGTEISRYKYLNIVQSEDSKIKIINETIEIHINDKLKNELTKAIKIIQNDIGDYSIETDDNQKIWFWGIK
ncbi:hypothetical protein PQO03_11470 [Lentisphaera profundi]|uniref:Uncharacterized protein n=1 Tax=Lentisphaera profundi TaxID=1658616 RepID=A0ABY7VW88_9BACT|nr:hypothetical protein [Lentisphaera profundi]WDE96328.1 hypothetical protein PQO03_11470 [Lentisphaera profundi]